MLEVLTSHSTCIVAHVRTSCFVQLVNSVDAVPHPSEVSSTRHGEGSRRACAIRKRIDILVVGRSEPRRAVVDSAVVIGDVNVVLGVVNDVVPSEYHLTYESDPFGQLSLGHAPSIHFFVLVVGWFDLVVAQVDDCPDHSVQDNVGHHPPVMFSLAGYSQTPNHNH